MNQTAVGNAGAAPMAAAVQFKPSQVVTETVMTDGRAIAMTNQNGNHLHHIGKLDRTILRSVSPTLPMAWQYFDIPADINAFARRKRDRVNSYADSEQGNHPCTSLGSP